MCLLVCSLHSGNVHGDDTSLDDLEGCILQTKFLSISRNVGERERRGGEGKERGREGGKERGREGGRERGSQRERGRGREGGGERGSQREGEGGKVSCCLSCVIARMNYMYILELSGV